MVPMMTFLFKFRVVFDISTKIASKSSLKTDKSSLILCYRQFLMYIPTPPPDLLFL